MCSVRRFQIPADAAYISKPCAIANVVKIRVVVATAGDVESPQLVGGHTPLGTRCELSDQVIGTKARQAAWLVAGGGATACK